jgi:hypothetical protein
MMGMKNLVLPSKDNVEYLVGDPSYSNLLAITTPYNEIVVEFLTQLSHSILVSPLAKNYSDIITFGYWCRSANLKKMKLSYPNIDNRKGLGIVFHIAPSNVPINFAFSYVFSLLTGNVSIVRVPSKKYEQVEIVSSIVNILLENPKFQFIKYNTFFIRYQQDDAITQSLSLISNARLIWGSDDTVQKIKSINTPSKCVDIPFSERYSFGIISVEEILNLNESDLKKLATGFFNDTYLMDQNACSSPQFLLWYFQDEKLINLSKKKFWDAVNEKVISDYDLSAKNSVDKLTWMCLDLVKRDNVSEVNVLTNHINRVQIDSLPNSIIDLKGKYGYFYEYSTNDLNDIKKIIDIKIQTLTYFGVNKNELFDIVYKADNIGIDRIVPIGSALEMGIIWDGYDMIYSLTKIIDLK